MNMNFGWDEMICHYLIFYPENHVVSGSSIIITEVMLKTNFSHHLCF
ncbi:hypothetical protein HMPREF1167_02082 [Aeromonas veronii AER39]|nr:hypothetical protein HMPREF1167_02082 [Aeromonas veronii AER39]